MADAKQVLARLPDNDDVSYIGLALNRRGVERALKTKVDEISCVVVATDTFGQKNQGENVREP